MARDITRVRAGNRTATSMELEIHLENAEVMSLRLNGEAGAAIIAAIVANCPSLAAPLTLDFPCYGFATSPSAEGHLALAFQLTQNRFPIAIRVPPEKLPEIRASIAKWEAQQPGKA